VYLLAAEPADALAAEAARDLALIGLERVAGGFGPEAIDHWEAGGRPVERSRSVGAREAADLAAAGGTILDVRGEAEWDAGHIPGAEHVPLGALPERLASLPAGRPVIVHCQGGGRSAIAASLLTAQGVREVVNLAGGFTEWSAEGLPVERGDSSLADLVVGPARTGKGAEAPS
jgi:hydroxyacylglutathione hydrolase